MGGYETSALQIRADDLKNKDPIGYGQFMKQWGDPAAVGGNLVRGYSSSQVLDAILQKGILHNKWKFAENLMRVGTEEAFGRDSAYNKMIGNISGGMGDTLDSDGFTMSGFAQALLQGAIRGGVSIGVAELEKKMPFNNPFLEAFAVNTLSAGISGAIMGAMGNGEIFSGALSGIQESWREFGSGIMPQSAQCLMPPRPALARPLPSMPPTSITTAV
jgi:hypothetical protein